jgi:NADPH:quinone reductase-like Zn-dependent oxidoreductase
MKAMSIVAPGGLDRLALVERPDPGEPGPGHIRVALHGSSLNFHDYAVCAGRAPTAEGRVPLADGAGVVQAVGTGVTDFSPGDAVVSCFFPDWHDGAPSIGDFRSVPGDGTDGFAQEVVVRSVTAFTRAPNAYTAVEAATITTAGLTAWRALVCDFGLMAGDTLLVLGTGGVSIWALLIARAMGARVAATSSSDAKLERLRALGADFTVNYKKEPQWGRAVRDWTNGRGVDHVIEVGGPKTLPESIEAVRVGGKIALIGVLTGRSGEIPTAKLVAKQVHLRGMLVGSRRQQQDFVRAIDATAIRPVIDQVFPLTELAAAFRREEQGIHFGNIGIQW